MLQAIREFHELPKEEKMEWYSRDSKQRVGYYCNGGLLVSKTAGWRDSIAFDYQDGPLEPEELPFVCRHAVQEYIEHLINLRDVLSSLMSEALGITSDYLAQIECMKSENLVCHYYPVCPEPEVTMGTTKHSDPSSLTLLLQDSIGGLQVMHQGHWVDIPPRHGALVANIGDFMQGILILNSPNIPIKSLHCKRRGLRRILREPVYMQLITNDKFKSVEHWVLAVKVGPRISAACFLYPSATHRSKPYGPIKELLSDNEPIYKETHIGEYLAHYRVNGLDGNSVLSHFKLPSFRSDN